MSSGRRRPWLSRGNQRPSHPLELQNARLARQRTQALRTTIVALAVIASAWLVYGHGPAFTFRIGQRPTRPVLVNVDSFRHLDPVKTNSERRARAEAVPPLLTNDPAPIHEIEEQLVDLVDAIARERQREALDHDLTTAWVLDEPTFLDIRAAVDSPERREELHRQIERAFATFMSNGVLGPDTLPSEEQSRIKLRIREANVPPSEARLVDRDMILRERIVKPDGPAARQFGQAFNNSQLGAKLFALVSEKVASTPTLNYEEKITKQEREAEFNAVEEAFRDYHRGDVLVRQGETITNEHLNVLRIEHETTLAELGWTDRLRRAGAVLVMVASLFALVGFSLVRSAPRVVSTNGRLFVLCVLIVLTLSAARLLALQPWDAELIPVALAGMILAVAYNPQMSLMVTFGLALLTSLALGQGIGHFLVLMGGTAAGVLPLREVRTRTKPIQVGLYSALAYFVLTWATGLFQNQAVGLVATDALWRAGWGLMAGFFLGGLLPFVEKAFGIVTGISLLELGDINHPLLQELVRRAPGTHNHSVTVGSIAEAAADHIGANGLLVRIGAYFHDIGKMLKPDYFVENQTGNVNRHANLNPAMSTLIIIGHVKDGCELARQHHLPQPIIDLVEQHHGTTLVEYFYREAARRCDANSENASLQESAFRYPGPKPQSKEAGILMISDAVESASRTLSEPTPGRIEGLVSELIGKRLEDGQFDECGLTLQEIAEIRESLVKSLNGIYHGRVKYPEQRTA
jgi:putative nucleotidyltransferase with HDIG domain